MCKIKSEYVKEFIEVTSESGCLLLSKEYVNSKAKLQIQCKCGEIFEVSYEKFKTRNKRQCNNCGRKNAIKKQSNKINVECDYCGELISKKMSSVKNTNFCSIECHGKWNSENYVGDNNPCWRGGKLKVKCLYCGTELEKYKSQIERSENHFCSIECHGKWNSENLVRENSRNWKGGKLKVKCLYCGKSKEINLYQIERSENHFCSIECHGKWNSENYVGDNNPCWRGGKLKVKCLYCGNTAMRYPSEVFDRNFCSRECFFKHNIAENNPQWNPILSEEDRCRGTYEYDVWRKEVYERDKYTCQCCGDSTGRNLIAHHLNGWNWDKENRYNIDNGICLCTSCHNEFHKKYKFGDNVKTQYEEFIKNKYKEVI